MMTVIVPKLGRGALNQLSPFLCRFKTTSVLMHEERRNEKSTIVKDEVEFYNKLANDWWDERGIMKGLHALNKLRVQFIREGLINTGKVDLRNVDSSHPLLGVRILEIGCGGGILTEALGRIGASVTGVDANKNMIEIAQLHASQDHSIADRITYVLGTIEEHSNESKNQYDAVVASEVLEHINQKELFLESCISTLKPGGSIFITTLNRTFAMWAGGILLGEYILRALPRGTHDIRKCIMPHEVQHILEKYGCSVKLTHGMLYNVFANEWLWSSYTKMNYALHAVRK